MTLPTRTRRAVMQRQGGRCNAGADCKSAERGPDGRRGVDLDALKRATDLHKYLPPGHAPVVFDHIIPQCDAVLQDGKPCVLYTDAETGQSVWIDVHDPRNVQALCGWCNQAKTEGERAGWDAPTPSPFANGIKPRAAWRPNDKALRLRSSAPAKNYAIL